MRTVQVRPPLLRTALIRGMFIPTQSKDCADKDCADEDCADDDCAGSTARSRRPQDGTLRQAHLRVYIPRPCVHTRIPVHTLSSNT